MTVNAAYRCTHGIVRTLVTMGILGTVGKMSILCHVLFVVAHIAIYQNTIG